MKHVDIEQSSPSLLEVQDCSCLSFFYRDIETIKEKCLSKVVIPAVLNTPVDEDKFMLNVQDIFENLSVHISDDLPKVLRKLCRTLNYSITNPKQSVPSVRNIWAFPAQTGIGKSVALQIYIAMLKDEASLIVVSKKTEANQYAENICGLAGDTNYARAVHSSPGINDFALGAIEDLTMFRCLVITHKRMEEIANADEKTQDKFRQFQLKNGVTKKRELVVIDEKLSFATQESVTINEYERLVEFVENALVFSKVCRALGKRSEVTKQLRILQDVINDKSNNLSGEIGAKLIEPEDLFEPIVKAKLPEKIDLQLFKEVAETRFDELEKEIRSIANTDNFRLDDKKKRINTLIERLSRILQIQNGDGEYCDLKTMYLFKTNRDTSICKFKQFDTAFGSCVVLDATATVNKFYETASSGWLPSFDVIDIPKIRKYENLKIFTAAGFPQSRYALSENIETIVSSMHKYKPVIDSLLSDEDRLLVVGHKSFTAILTNEYKKDDPISFTYWGNHVGRNDWNDCSKVLVIGWNYLPPIETATQVFGAHMPSGDISAISKLTPTNIEAFQTAQLAEDIIQAVMRTRARVIADKDSDCLPTEVYLLYPSTQQGQDVIQVVTDEFPQAKLTTDWKPPVGIDPSSLSKPEKNANQILLILDELKKQGNNEISWKETREAAGFSSSTFSKAVNESYFQTGLKSRDMKSEKINGRQKKFVF